MSRARLKFQLTGRTPATFFARAPLGATLNENTLSLSDECPSDKSNTYGVYICILRELKFSPGLYVYISQRYDYIFYDKRIARKGLPTTSGRSNTVRYLYIC